MRRHFQEWVNVIHGEDVEIVMGMSDRAPSCSFSHEDWTVTLTAVPRHETNMGKPISPLITWPHYLKQSFSKKLRSEAKRKANAYRQIDGPLLVAINDLGGADKKLDVPVALFGWERDTDQQDRVSIVPPAGVNRRDWLWDHEKNTTISAILLLNGLHPNRMASASVCLYENPRARHPISHSLRLLPHAIVENNDLCWYPGQVLHSILDLPATAASIWRSSRLLFRQH